MERGRGAINPLFAGRELDALGEVDVVAYGSEVGCDIEALASRVDAEDAEFALARA